MEEPTAMLGEGARSLDTALFIIKLAIELKAAVLPTDSWRGWVMMDEAGAPTCLSETSAQGKSMGWD
jgi:hypothetical protein